ncbi:DUF1840 domain-containing protein [Inhella gelatinilytica]|uniref:DUF1840 domain-containing protein n=1 Tax=Inhella gelatinilytica TaxID=2795030 RepID=A0A931IW59_9BURK|nr:DUF1840 domain-containing protein [Inhella gelatinilytica]MBH9553912.1 DUF1840 domain-containing protein [Inhella gelatinilytica]
MLIRFSSKADADVLMLASHAQEVLTALGRPFATQGIFLVEQIPVALASATATLDDSQPLAPTAAVVATEVVEDSDAISDAGVSLRQRLWPVQTLLQRALAAGQAVQWQPL